MTTERSMSSSDESMIFSRDRIVPCFDVVARLSSSTFVALRESNDSSNFCATIHSKLTRLRLVSTSQVRIFKLIEPCIRCCVAHTTLWIVDRTLASHRSTCEYLSRHYWNHHRTKCNQNRTTTSNIAISYNERSFARESNSCIDLQHCA